VGSASPASDGAPPTTAPPSFGRADADDSGTQSESSSGLVSPDLTVPLFGPDKPWWAADDEEEASPAVDAESEDEAEAGTEEETRARETPGGAPDAERQPQAPPRPGTLVAGVGVPPVDSRGAVPAEPLQPETLPSYPDTDPDGIPLYPGPQEQPAEQPAAAAAERVPTIPAAQPAAPGPAEQPAAPSAASPTTPGATSPAASMTSAPPPAAPEAPEAAAAASSPENPSSRTSTATGPQAAVPPAAPGPGASQAAQKAQDSSALDSTRPDVTPSLPRDSAAGSPAPSAGAATGPSAGTPSGPSSEPSAGPSEGPRLDQTVPDARSALPVPVVGAGGKDAEGGESKEDKGSKGARTRPLDPLNDTSDALTPDAVLPPGVMPPEYTGPKHEDIPHASAYARQPGDGFVVVMSQETTHQFQQPGPQEAHRPPAAAHTAEDTEVRRRNALLIGVVALVVAIPIIVLGAFGLASGSGDAASQAAATPTKTPPAAPPPASTRPPATPRPSSPGPSKIDDERSDPRPLALLEVFPEREVVLAEKFFIQDKTSVNHQCGLAARGVMVQALERGKCRSVVRATFVNRIKTIAVTTGVAVMPTHQAALAANRAGRPADYEWFRAMPGKRSPDIDRAGGYAAGTVRGRYIVYAYATWADGTKPKPGDPVLKQVAEAFIAYGLRPIERRAAKG